MLEELKRMPSNMRSDLIELGRIAAVKDRLQRVFMKHVQSRKSMNTKTNKRGLPTCLLSDTLDAASTGSTLPKEQDPIHTCVLGTP